MLIYVDKSEEKQRERDWIEKKLQASLAACIFYQSDWEV